MSDSRIQIPSLRPWGLEDVPNGPDWFLWRDNVKPAVLEVQELCTYGDDEFDPTEYQRHELELCAEDPARFIAFWLWIEEPRVINDEDTVKPFIPFGFQVELAQWFAEKTALQERYDGYVSKSRGLGASWIFCALAVWAWLFRPWRGLLVSRNASLVDNRGDLNSLFGKIDFILDLLPEWMLPEGFDPEVHRLKNYLQHPVHPNVQIVGEATTSKAARGARATYIFYDECAFIPEFIVVFGTGAGTTNHRWCVSSESFEEGDSWWMTWHAAQERDPGAVRELNYWLNPYFTEEYIETERTIAFANDEEGFNAEYLRNPFAGNTWIYPEVRSIKHFVDEWYDEKELLLVGIDPGRADDTAISFMQFVGYEEPRRVRWIDSYSCSRMPAEYYAHILTGIPPDEGDECVGVTFDSYAEYIMAWMYDLPWTDAMRVFCDPSGSASNRDNSGKAFTDRIMQTSRKLREREYKRLVEAGDNDKLKKPVPIVPLYEELFSANRHDKRHLALRTLLLRSEFSNTQGARRLKNALENYRFQTETGKQTSDRSPLHDAYSHLSVSAEYIATFCSIGLGRIKPRREREPKTFIDPLSGTKRKIR